MSDYKLIAFDMDGTLLNTRKTIGEKTLKAIADAAAAGKHIVVNTGRSIPEMWDFMDRVPGLKYLITTNGSVLYDVEKRAPLQVTAIDGDKIRELMDRVEGRDLMVQFLTEDRSVCEAEKLKHVDKYSMGQYRATFEKVCTQVEDLRVYFEQTGIAVPKMNFYHTSPEERVLSRIATEGIDVERVDSETASLEFTAKGVSKGAGLRRLCDLLGISIEQAIAVGDSGNDAAMLREAGLGIAVGNATEEIKAICGAVVADCDHDGCAEAVYRYLMAE